MEKNTVSRYLDVTETQSLFKYTQRATCIEIDFVLKQTPRKVFLTRRQDN